MKTDDPQKRFLTGVIFGGLALPEVTCPLYIDL